MAVVLSFAMTVASLAANAQMGTWKLNEAKSKIAAGMGKNYDGHLRRAERQN